MDQDVTYADLKFPPRAQQTDVKKAESKAPALKRTPRTWLLIVAILCVLLLGALIFLSILYLADPSSLLLKGREISGFPTVLLMTRLRKIVDAATQHNVTNSRLLAGHRQLSDDSKQAKSKTEQVEGRFSQLLKWALDTQICALAAPASNTSEPRNVSCSFCPCQWISNNRSCYFFSQTVQSWNGSRKECHKEKADLVVIADREEQDFLAKKQNQMDYWIGLTDAKQEGLWMWVDGTALNLMESFWDSPQPDNDQNNEHCASLTSKQNLHNWNDAPCNKNYRYICEKAADTITLSSL